MPKVNYLRGFIASLELKQLQEIVEEYAQQDKSFEAFLLEKTGKAIDTGKSYQEYYEELEKVLKKCTTRRGFVKVGRLNGAGVRSTYQLLQSHFKNENFSTALWISLALMEALHQAILMNTRYRSIKKPYKVFEYMFLECRDQFDTAYRLAPPARKDRKGLVEALVRCWWRERERTYEQHYFEIDDLFRYAKRDEDFIALQDSIQQLKPHAQQLDKKHQKNLSTWKRVWADYFVDQPEDRKPGSLGKVLDDVEVRIKKSLEQWH